MTSGTDAIAALTDKECEALRLWYTQATAKEIALELGISHHAVEKRLKSARAKLGVTTSRDAARLLAEAEGYDQAASGPAEVPSSPARGPSWQHPILLIGGIVMLLATLTAFALAQTASEPANPSVSIESSLPEVTVIRDGEDRSPAFDKVFARLDRDQSGFLESGELEQSSIRLTRVPAKGAEARTRQVDPLMFDADKDGRLSKKEYDDAIAAAMNR